MTIEVAADRTILVMLLVISVDDPRRCGIVLLVPLQKKQDEEPRTPKDAVAAPLKFPLRGAGCAILKWGIGVSGKADNSRVRRPPSTRGCLASECECFRRHRSVKLPEGSSYEIDTSKSIFAISSANKQKGVVQCKPNCTSPAMHKRFPKFRF